MATKQITVTLEWEHALMLPQVLDIAIAQERKRLARQKTPRWQTKTRAKIQAALHARERVHNAVMQNLNL